MIPQPATIKLTPALARTKCEESLPHWPNAGLGIVKRLTQILEIVWNSGDCSRKPVWKRAKSWTPYPLFASQLYSCELPKPVVLLAERKLFQLWDLAIVMCRALWHPNILLDWQVQNAQPTNDIKNGIKQSSRYSETSVHIGCMSQKPDTISENRKELQHGTLEWAHGADTIYDLLAGWTPHLWMTEGGIWVTECGIQCSAPESDCCSNCLVTSNYLLKGNMFRLDIPHPHESDTTWIPKHLQYIASNLTPTATTLIGQLTLARWGMTRQTATSS